MISGRRLKVFEKGKTSTKTFAVKNGLQQGGINSTILFNLFFSDLLTLFKINEDQRCKAIAYADDLIIYSHYKKVSVVRDKLQQDVIQKINNYCNNWKIKINFNKCETILFKSKVSRLGSDARKEWKNFNLLHPTDHTKKIEHRTAVKYLGITLNQKYNFNQQALNQLDQATTIWIKIEKNLLLEVHKQRDETTSLQNMHSLCSNERMPNMVQHQPTHHKETQSL